jgi:probable aminopeptidase NPEPL1
MAPTISFVSTDDALAGADALVLLGSASRLADGDVLALLPSDVAGHWDGMLGSVAAGDKGGSTRTWSGSDLRQVVAAVLPDKASRHNSPGRPDAVPGLVGGALGGGVSVAAVIIAVADPAHCFAAGLGVARAFPLFDGKSKKKTEDDPKPELTEVRVAFVGDGGDAPLQRLRAGADGIRLAARLVDEPTSVLHTAAFLAEAEAVAAEVGADIEVIAASELEARGFGGLWGVGKAAVHGPALVVLKHEPAGASETVAWVGKGIVYDTGGLSIKSSGGMPGMKADMGGAAAVLGAFAAAARLGATVRIHALLCLAENSVGPESVRPDDIITLYSGKTVEVNNTDAEGRLVLGDGVAYASKHLDASVIVDLATLTGAQLVSTGRRHAAIVCNDDDLEARAIAAGKRCGDLVHPLPFVPEFYRREFASKVADLKNSVKDRMNAQSSCAAQFVYEHIETDWDGAWLHVDLAGPATNGDDRGTGYGVGLLLELFDIGA